MLSEALREQSKFRAEKEQENFYAFFGTGACVERMNVERLAQWKTASLSGVRPCVPSPTLPEKANKHY